MFPEIQTVIYATYEDDGASGPGGQDETTFPKKVLLIFDDYDQAREYARNLLDTTKGRKNPHITGFYTQDKNGIELYGLSRVQVFTRDGAKDAKRKGRQAYFNGVPFQNNPYLPDDVRYGEWSTAWIKAQEE